MYYLGFDIGSSSIKAAILDAGSNQPVAVVSHPEKEMDIMSVQPGWAEQDPEMWWEHLISATKKVIAKAGINGHEIDGIGISYQMHGLVLVDENQQVLRPSIIWCDGRAVTIGDQAFAEMGEAQCLAELLNSPGNFTASKLKWVHDNEPELYAKVHKFMLPGDFIAMKLSGEINTTIAGLSEGMIWDFKSNEPSKNLFDHYGLNLDLVPDVKPTFSVQGQLSSSAAELLGLKPGITIGYRGGDQPNNAMSLGVLNAGEVAGTGGTSGVLYGVNAQPVFDEQSRINSFAHVNYSASNPNIGVLLCINGAGIQYRWMNQFIAKEGTSYPQMEEALSRIPVGADGLRMLPFGNGAERVLGNKDIGAQLSGLQFNRHSQPHLFRAALEGVAFAFIYGGEIMQQLGLDIKAIRVGNDNLFQSKVFSETIATLLDAKIEMVETTGAIGAARAAAFTNRQFATLGEAMKGDKIITTYEPLTDQGAYQSAFEDWKNYLNKLINQ